MFVHLSIAVKCWFVVNFWFCSGGGGIPTAYPAYGCVGSDTDAQATGAATEPPPPPTVGCVRPTVMTVAIVAHDNEVLDSLETSVMELLVWRLDMMEVSVLRMVVHLQSSYFLLDPMHADMAPIL